MAWSARFELPIEMPAGKALVTLRDAANYIMALPKRVSEQPAWQLALHCLIDAAEDRGPRMHARIAVLRALNAGKPATPERRKNAVGKEIIGG